MAPLVELVSLITSAPTFITREEHNERTQATPASFSDIPPVLVHREDNVIVELDPPLEGLSAADCAAGTLYVIESALVFVSSSGSGRGFEIHYTNITLHAVSRGGDERPSIYCQLDDVSGEDEDNGFNITTSGPSNGHLVDRDEDDEEEDDEEDYKSQYGPNSTLRELKIIPQNESSLEPIFEALSHCASLHSDAVPDSDDDMGEDDAFVDADDDGDGAEDAEARQQELTEVGRAALQYLESIIQYPSGTPDISPPKVDKVDDKISAEFGQKASPSSTTEGNGNKD